MAALRRHILSISWVIGKIRFRRKSGTLRSLAEHLQRNYVDDTMNFTTTNVLLFGSEKGLYQERIRHRIVKNIWETDNDITLSLRQKKSC